VTERAAFRQAEITRAIRAAKAAGCELRIENGAMRFLPMAPGAELPSGESDKPAVEKALAAWRRSA
jgi:hypothetical protein